MDSLSSSDGNSSIVNGEKSNENEEQWKAEEAIGGNAQALLALRELIVFPLLYSREARKLGLKWPRGLLLYGPPGTGKTSLVRAIVRESGAHLIVLSPHSVHRAHAGESEKILREAFSEASSHANSGKPSVIFIDEIDELCPRRDSRREQDVRVASQLFTLMDSNKPSPTSIPRVVVVASTNRVEAIDPALRRSGRFDAEVEVTTPNEEERFQILKLYTKKVPLDPNVDLQAVAASCNGYVGADLEALCREATMLAVKRSTDIGENPGALILTMEDWKHAKSVVGPSITRGVTVEIPKVSWEDIGGLKDLKKKLRQAVEWPIKHSAAFSRLGISPMRGILLHGPPGCSKTTLAKAAAHAAQASFFSLRAKMPSMVQTPNPSANDNLSFNYNNNNNNNNKPNFFARSQKILEQRKSLPIASVERRLIEEVRKHDILIIVGETGSGKTTQIPQFLFNAGFCRGGKTVGITQPKRVAAVTVAKRVAEECGVELGQKVGYSIRFEDVTSSSTSIKYMTDGLLLREALLDPYLSKYSVIIIDEAHERTVHTDVLLGLLKKVHNVRSKYVREHTRIGQKRASDGAILEKENADPRISVLKQCEGRKLPPLKLIIMSASLDARVFSEYFGGARAVHIQGRQFPVDVFYTVYPQTDYLDSAIITIFQIHLEEAPGDILVFLTGQEEIESVEKQIQDNLRQLPEDSRKMSTVPIFSSLPSEQQMRVFAPAPAGFRKVILATNIAETSVTIPGVKYVIDPGVVKARCYDPIKGMESLIVVPTSKAQALQRSGRAGREGPGKCFRLYPESEFEKLEDSTKPEIKRCNLSNVILQLKALGVDDIFGFDFIEKPSRAAIKRSVEELILLGALTDDCKLSDPVGHQMARLPLDPIYSKALILASQFNCLEEMLIAVAMLSVESIFYEPREKKNEARTAKNCFASPEGDHLTLINVYRASNDLLEKRKSEVGKDKHEKILRKWCKENFISSRSLRHARDIHSQIQRHVEQMGLCISSCGDDTVQFRRCLAAAFFLNAALKQPDKTYRALASGEVVHVHPTSVLFHTKADCIIFNEFVKTSKKYIRNVTIIDGFWLTELAPHYYAKQE